MVEQLREEGRLSSTHHRPRSGGQGSGEVRAIGRRMGGGSRTRCLHDQAPLALPSLSSVALLTLPVTVSAPKRAVLAISTCTQYPNTAVTSHHWVLHRPNATTGCDAGSSQVQQTQVAAPQTFGCCAARCLLSARSICTAPRSTCNGTRKERNTRGRAAVVSGGCGWRLRRLCSRGVVHSVRCKDAR